MLVKNAYTDWAISSNFRVMNNYIVMQTRWFRRRQSKQKKIRQNNLSGTV